MEKTGSAVFRITIAILAVLAAWGIVWYTIPVTAGIQAGLLTCSNVVIPTLFPFMTLASFIASTDLADTISRPFSLITRYVFRLPSHLGCIIIMSLIGGYPVGAKAISAQLEQGRIDEKTASRMLCFCCNAGPSFVISAVGVGIFKSFEIGVILFVCQALSSVIIGALFSLRQPVGAVSSAPKENTPYSTAFVWAVSGSVTGLLIICGFVVLFSALMRLFDALGVITALSGYLGGGIFSSELLYSLISGVLEVTSGCISLSAAGFSIASIGLAAFLISFSGLSIIFQVKSYLFRYKINFGSFFISRILHGSITCLLALAGLRIFRPALPAAMLSSPPSFVKNPNLTPLTACLLGLCCIFMLSLTNLVPVRFPKRTRRDGDPADSEIRR